MGLQIDWTGRLILITSPQTTATLQDIHDFVEDERAMASPRGMSVEEIFPVIEGKIEDPQNPGVYTQIFLQLSSLWQLQFWGGSGYTSITGGKISGGVNGEVMKATGTAGDITVLVSQVDGTVAISTSAEGDLEILKKMAYNKAVVSGQTLTIYDDDNVSVWKQFDLTDGSRIEI